MSRTNTRVPSWKAASPWPVTVVRTGLGPDGTQAVRDFQRAILTREIKLMENLSLASAIKESTLTRGRTGMATVDKARSAGRIDVLSAAMFAVFAGSRYKPSRGIRSSVA